MLVPVVLLAALSVLQQTPAPVQTPPSPPASNTAQPVTSRLETVEVVGDVVEPVPGTQVCRTEAVTGSRFGRRVCRNSAQTAEERRTSQEMLRRMQGARMPDS